MLGKKAIEVVNQLNSSIRSWKCYKDTFTKQQKGLVHVMWGILIAILSGAMMSVQGVFNTGVTKQTGIWVSAGFVQLTALIVCLGAWFITGKQGSFSSILRISNKYMLLGGVLGAFITFTVIKSVHTLGPAMANMFIITAQLIIAYLIEVFGIFGSEKIPFEWRKLIGVIFVIIGIIIFQWNREKIL